MPLASGRQSANAKHHWRDESPFAASGIESRPFGGSMSLEVDKDQELPQLGVILRAATMTLVKG